MLTAGPRIDLVVRHLHIFVDHYTNAIQNLTSEKYDKLLIKKITYKYYSLRVLYNFISTLY